MSVTLDQILALAGRLDESRDFDSARERFRRFLREHVTDIGILRALVDQARYSPDDQHRRALQDLVVLSGRFLGFDVDIGAPVSPLGVPLRHGTWHAPGRLRVIVEAGTATSSPSIAGIAAALDEGSSGTPVVHLFVPVSLPAFGRSADAGGAPQSPRVMPVAELLDLAEMTTKGRLAGIEVIRILEMGIPLDFVSGLLDRPERPGPATASPSVSESVEETYPRAHDSRPDSGHEPVRTAEHGSGYWMASVPPDYATTPEEFLEVVVAKRHVFGVTDRGTVVGTVRTGDGICFYLPGKGVVGHAWVTSIADGASDLRDARRFRQVLRLDRLSLHLARPTTLDVETELRLRAAPSTANRHAQMLLEISPESFRALSEPAVKVRMHGRLDESREPDDTREDRLPGRGRLSS
jgi:hypothetical protein